MLADDNSHTNQGVGGEESSVDDGVSVEDVASGRTNRSSASGSHVDEADLASDSDESSVEDDADWWDDIDAESWAEMKDLVEALERLVGKSVLDKCSLVDVFGGGDDDDGIWEDLDLFRLLLQEKRRKRRPKHHQKRKDIEHQSFVLLTTRLFKRRFRMPKEHLDYLLEALHKDISIDIKQSTNSTQGKAAPISTSLVVRCGIDRLAHNTSDLILQELYGISLTSTKRIIDVFLDAVDNNTSCPELQIRLPDSTKIDELDALAKQWSGASTVYKLFDGFLGALDGWLPRTEMPRGVSNQVDYFSGHYQCYGLNVQAMCDTDLLFLYCAVAAPGKVNDIRAFHRCEGLQQWIQSLPEDYYIGADNAYPLSRKILIPFSGPELTSEAKRSYNFYLSQLRIRIEMAFGRLTTKWRILRSALACLPSKNAKIIRVCMKLHNFIIRMEQKDGGGRLGVLESGVIDPSKFGIDALANSPFGFFETTGPEEECDGEFESSLEMGHDSRMATIIHSSERNNNYGEYTVDNSLRDELVDEILERKINRPNYNRRRNREWDDNISIDSDHCVEEEEE